MAFSSPPWLEKIFVLANDQMQMQQQKQAPMEAEIPAEKLWCFLV